MNHYNIHSCGACIGLTEFTEAAKREVRILCGIDTFCREEPCIHYAYSCSGYIYHHLVCKLEVEEEKVEDLYAQSEHEQMSSDFPATESQCWRLQFCWLEAAVEDTLGHFPSIHLAHRWYKFEATENDPTHEYGNATAIFETKPLYEKRQNLNTGEHDTETASMPSLSLSCVGCR